MLQDDDQTASQSLNLPEKQEPTEAPIILSLQTDIKLEPIYEEPAEPITQPTQPIQPENAPTQPDTSNAPLPSHTTHKSTDDGQLVKDLMGGQGALEALTQTTATPGIFSN